MNKCSSWSPPCGCQVHNTHTLLLTSQHIMNMGGYRFAHNSSQAMRDKTKRFLFGNVSNRRHTVSPEVEQVDPRDAGSHFRGSFVSSIRVVHAY